MAPEPEPTGPGYVAAITIADIEAAEAEMQALGYKLPEHGVRTDSASKCERCVQVITYVISMREDPVN